MNFTDGFGIANDLNIKRGLNIKRDLDLLNLLNQSLVGHPAACPNNQPFFSEKKGWFASDSALF